MFQLYCDMCAKPTEYKDMNYLEFNHDEDLVYHLCPLCFKNEIVRYSNYRLVTSQVLKNKLDTETKNKEKEDE